jgi:glycosyltransferase involved in cell wall biosynthesis
MKIAQVLYRYYPYIGGVEAVVKETSEVMVRKGVHVEVLTQDRTGNLPPIEEINGVVIRRFRTGALGWDFALRKGSLRNYLLRNSSEFDLVHAHTCHTFCPLYAAWAKGENRLVINTHYHGVGHDRLMNLLHRPYRRVVKAALGKADKVVCVSETEGLIVKDHFGLPDARISIIGNGVHYDRIARATPFPVEGKVVLFVGRLERYKNVHLAVEAMPHMPPEYTLTVIGNGPYRESLSRLVANLGLEERVQILTGLTDEEVHRWYRTCTVALNLSSQEAFGITVLEALAAGKPVVVNDRKALSELAGRLTGVWAVDAEGMTHNELADRIVGISEADWEKPDLSPYSWEAVTDQILSLYRSL